MQKWNFSHQVCSMFSIVSLLGILLSQSSFASSRQTIAQSEQTVPGNNGQFNIFLGATINSFNEVIFTAQLINTSEGEADDTALYRMALPSTVNPAVITLEEVIRENQLLTVSDRSFHISDLYIDISFRITNRPLSDSLAAGDFTNLALMLPLVPNSNELGNSIIAVESENSIVLIAEAGATVESGNGEYREFNIFSLVGIGSNNQVIFFSSLDNTENDAEDNTAYFKRSNDNSIDELVRKGDSVNGGILTHPGGLETNDNGNGVFSGQNDSEDVNNNSGLYKVSGSSYSLVVHEGDIAPTDDTENRYFSALTDARINNHNQIGFKGMLQDENGFAVTNGSGLFLADNLSIKNILQKGQTTPDGTATYGNLLSPFSATPRPAMNDLGQLALIVDLLTEDAQINGVFRASETEVLELARKHLSYEDGSLRNFQDPAINNSGLVVFQADLAIEEVFDDEGSYLRTEDILIITDGVHYETIERGGREHNGKVISEIFFNNNPYGPANGLSDTGTVVYTVRYEDGHRGILAWIPDFGWRTDVTQGVWDDVSHWDFGGLPDQFTDVILNPEQPTDILGPIADTTIKSLSLGGTSGSIDLTLQNSTLSMTGGLVVHSGSSIFGQGSIDSSVQNEGLIEVLENQSLTISGEMINDGQITINEGSQLTFLANFTGVNPIQGNGTVTFNGEIQLTDEPGLLTIQGSLNLTEDSALKIAIAGLERGESYSAIDVGDTVSLGGTLQLTISDNLNLSDGDTVELLQAGQISGEFDNLMVPDLSEQGLQLSVNQSTTKLELVVTQDADPLDTDASSGSGAINIGLFLLLLLPLIRYIVDSKRAE
ncbi:hypothetical protein Q4574_15650 [Aliiglaciecola sp. 3_MG-2023]|uniref:DUF7453 family protein n=1 Tax=Aliiglaciecola sp. 3_MG-2023 TaxID=3062644 RepID=UPI0026E246B8|nr:choice-of-anchor tandem repeat NxxGxxAF-containing protein [Aliiglaciecola sp. 3_MG-2023]MDO6694732.1 hypothetical protein [Aliiglaciecola sp. 3_MG-2023]